jgi:hypothetical protein
MHRSRLVNILIECAEKRPDRCVSIRARAESNLGSCVVLQSCSDFEDRAAVWQDHA